MERVIEVVQPHSAKPSTSLGLFLRVAGGRFYRVAPTRDPRQPRFWCLVVFRCTSSGVPQPTEQPWVGNRGLTRAELPAALAAIRSDVDAWLAEPGCEGLRAWMLAGEPAAPLPAALRPQTASRAGAVKGANGRAVPGAGD